MNWDAKLRGLELVGIDAMDITMEKAFMRYFCQTRVTLLYPRYLLDFVCIVKGCVAKGSAYHTEPTHFNRNRN